jgi:DNA mismatch endonuclease (patch repair protein)
MCKFYCACLRNTDGSRAPTSGCSRWLCSFAVQRRTSMVSADSVDNVSKQRRSEIMRSVRSRDTQAERVVRSYLHRQGFRFRVDVGWLPGRPDIVMRKHNAVVFVHGCFWHGHRSTRCKLARMPKSNVEFWRMKVCSNKKRDAKVQRKLRNLGWRVFVLWECGLRRPQTLEKLAERIAVRPRSCQI